MNITQTYHSIAAPFYPGMAIVTLDPARKKSQPSDVLKSKRDMLSPRNLKPGVNNDRLAPDGLTQRDTKTLFQPAIETMTTRQAKAHALVDATCPLFSGTHTGFSRIA